MNIGPIKKILSLCLQGIRFTIPRFIDDCSSDDTGDEDNNLVLCKLEIFNLRFAFEEGTKGEVSQCVGASLNVASCLKRESVPLSIYR